MSKKARFWFLALIALVLLSSCMPGDGKATPEDPAGFWQGIWHGFIAPISLIVQIFKPSIRLYEAENTGFWYDLGFYLAAISGLGGAAAGKRRAAGHRRRDEET